MGQQKKIIKNGDQLHDLVVQLSEQITAAHSDLSDLVFVGILSSGYPIAERISHQIQKDKGVKIPVGKLDVALYRDDLFSRGGFVTIRESDIPFSIENKTLVLVDDVLFHGRTIRAALNALLDFGRPDRVELAVLVDRGHRELPIFAHYIGLPLETTKDDHIRIRLLEIDGDDSIVLLSPA